MEGAKEEEAIKAQKMASLRKKECKEEKMKRLATEMRHGTRVKFVIPASYDRSEWTVGTIKNAKPAAHISTARGSMCPE